MARTVVYWRRADLTGLERLELEVEADAVTAHGSLINLEAGGLRIEHRWRLTPDWRALAVRVERWNDGGHAALRLERTSEGWNVDGAPRPDLSGAEEPDLSVTPFCNTLPIRRTRDSLTLDVAYMDGAALTVARSRQRYERLASDRLRYVDLGLSKGFTAELEVDGEGLVRRYEHLFERVAP